MKRVCSKQVLNHPKTVQTVQVSQKNTKKYQSQKKQSFSDLINSFKEFLKIVVNNEVHLIKSYQILSKLRQKYEHDIFAIYEANLKIQTLETKRNQNQNNIKNSQNQVNRKVVEKIDFLPLQSIITFNRIDYKVTLNGSDVKQTEGKKMLVKTKKTMDTQKSSDQNEESRQISRWRSVGRQEFINGRMKSPKSQKQIQIESTIRNQYRNPIQSDKVIKGVDYLSKQMQYK